MNRLFTKRLSAGMMIIASSYTPLFGNMTATVAFAQSLPNATTFKYDAVGNLTEINEPLARKTIQRFDPMNRVIQQERVLPNVSAPLTQYSYDGLDQLSTVTDPRNLVTRYVADGLGNQAELSSPDTGLSTSTYDVAGNLKTRTDGRGKKNTYTYDALDRLTRIDHTGAVSTTFEYDGGATPILDATGRLTRMTDESGSTTYAYDGLGRLKTKVQNIIASPTNFTQALSYAYDSSGRLASVTYPSGNRVNYGYDKAGRVGSITLNPVQANGSGTNTESTIVLLDNISYAPFGASGGWSWGNSTVGSKNVHVRTFDLEGRPRSYTLGNPAANGVVRTVRYDVASRITGYTHTGSGTVPLPANLDQTFGYDNLDRLISYSGNGTTQTYAYDATGNRIKGSFGAASYTNIVDPLSNKLSSTTGPLSAKTNTYDGAGNLTGDGNLVVTYSGRGRPYSIKNGAITVYQLFNGIGQRVLQSYGGGLFAYDEQGHLVGEYNASTGKPTRETVYLGDLPVAVLTQTVAGTAPSQVTATNVFHVHPDHLGTPRMITRALDNKIVWRWDNGDPFGLTPPTEYFSGTGTFTFNLRMPGQYYDRNTNLFYNYHRDYDPQTGRYIQSDPIGLKGGINTYSYVNGNPLSHIDPTGEAGILPAAGGVVVGGYFTFKMFQKQKKCEELCVLTHGDAVITCGDPDRQEISDINGHNRVLACKASCAMGSVMSRLLPGKLK
ncbi:RHS repeat-associated core domain-containing protein [Massilia pseudoviolaceinigra]|uniref:RHS repeat-associated core domain-containing protein n=1 Tax=Massilia pseudoviolaceinigra TaxID=3057165 RepID=UPI002796CF30|nr:RHS repeat-associated core domain-containing protein [Massilia sp. CCM 9206]MDQ1925062.1 RHS repeat-associated core domain-containing protein [Massilia sp. CCM 9206]